MPGLGCLTYIREGDGMSHFVLGDAEQSFVTFPDHEVSAGRVLESAEALLSYTAFVNRRSLERDEKPALVLVLL
jgi:hypothetical protein